ncbi:MAG: helix-turn-helix transcriptional regulator [Candidatus Latescibacteria bacterium]|nr:helix-turn-helix transcriptional regulator [Candidatus Latescibacterota bacterium]
MISKTLVAASTRPIILSILFSGENYGYEIIQRVKGISGGTMEWSDGMLYPVLHRLEREGLIVSQWKVSDGTRPRKYYTITDTGRTELAAERKQWLNVHEAMLKLWEPLPALK